MKTTMAIIAAALLTLILSPSATVRRLFSRDFPLQPAGLAPDFHEGARAA